MSSNAHSSPKAAANPAEGHRERLRNRLLRDPTALLDHEILELALGFVIRRKDTKPLAKRLLQRFGDVRSVREADCDALLQVEGVGPAVAAFFEVIRELECRCAEAPLKKRRLICSTQSVLKLARPRLGAKMEEEMWAAFVDNGNRLLAWERLSKGTVNAAPLYPREVAKQCYRLGASGFVLVHNHPGGNPAPSASDIELTREMALVARTMKLRFLDHIIVTDEGHCSFRDDQLLDDALFGRRL